MDLYSDVTPSGFAATRASLPCKLRFAPVRRSPVRAARIAWSSEVADEALEFTPLGFARAARALHTLKAWLEWSQALLPEL